jgi:ribulose-5-phosphate 4-epimerase/fuculose-1-phosphate aldolase
MLGMANPSENEGVIRFQLEHSPAPAPQHPAIADLQAWHTRLHALHVIGRDPERYGGYAFGNMSVRGEAGGFIVSGTQTGGLARLQPQHYAEVTDYDIDANRVRSHGPIQPSSECMTHAAVYASDPAIQAVIHVHSPELWQACERLYLRSTAREIGYGTPAMAHAVADIIQSSCHPQQGILCMGGHEDGVIAWGESVEQAGTLLLDTLAMV